MKYYQVFISAEDKQQAEVILNTLLTKKLVLGGPVFEGPAKFWWKKEIISMNYCYVLTYTTEFLKQKMMDEAIKASVEEVPMISLIPMEVNPKLARLIDETLGT